MSHLSIPNMTRARALDLSARIESGDLTTAETLALNVLNGGPLGEETIPILIDKASEEYGNGSYRVPVRVIADLSRTLAIVSSARSLTPRAKEYITESVHDVLRSAADKNGSVRFPATIILDGGLTIAFYEIAGMTTGPAVQVEDAT